MHRRWALEATHRHSSSTPPPGIEAAHAAPADQRQPLQLPASHTLCSICTKACPLSAWAVNTIMPQQWQYGLGAKL